MKEAVDVYNGIMALAKLIIVDTQQLVSLVNEDASEESMESRGKETEKHTKELQELVASDISPNCSSLNTFEFLIDSSKTVVLTTENLVSAAKAALSNRFDFLTQQKLRNCCLVVAESIKNLISAAESLKSEAVKVRERADSIADGQTVSNADLLDVAQDAKNAIMAINKVKTLACEGSETIPEEEFLLSAKEASSAATELLITARSFKLNSIADNLRDATVGVISSAKMLFNDPEDEVLKEQLNVGMSKLAEAIKNIVYTVKNLISQGEETKTSTSNKSEPTSILNSVSVPTDTSKFISSNSGTDLSSLTSNNLNTEAEKRAKILREKLKEKQAIEEKKEEEARQKERDILAKLNTEYERLIKLSETQSLDKKQKEQLKKLEKALKKETSKKAKADKKQAEKEKRVIKAKAIPEGVETEQDKEEKLYRDLTERILNSLLEKYKKFGEEFKNQPPEIKSKLKEKISAEIKATMTSILAYRASRRLSVEESVNSNNLASSTTMTPEKKTSQYAEWRKQSVVFQFDRVYESEIHSLHSPNGRVEEIKIAEEIVNVAKLISLSVVDLIVVCSDYVLDPKSDIQILTSTVKEALMHIETCLSLALQCSQKSNRSNPLIDKILENSIDISKSSPLKGKPEESLVEVASGFTPTARLIEGSLQDTIYEESNSVRILSIQLVAILLNLASQLHSGRVHSTLLILSGSIQNWLSAKDSLLNAVETARFIANSRNKENTLQEDDVVKILDFGSEDVNIWEETTVPIIEDDTVKSGTLNNLVLHLTSEEKLDNTFMKTFLTTYQSFTTPAKLLEKLIQRYPFFLNFKFLKNIFSFILKMFTFNSPLNKDKMKQIQLRVSIVLKHWVESQFKDFDDALIQKLFYFFETDLSPNHGELGGILKKELQRKVHERNAHLHAVLSEPPAEITFLEMNNLSTMSFFMALNETEIARQLTLIDFKIFEAIEPAELLNQSWNKNNLKHRSRHVLSLISRANRVSFWVASLILFHDTVKDRATMVQKFITIGEELRKLNNYHTLMGIIAGLNMSSVTRLKKSLEEVPQSYKELFASLEKLMSPNSSYKVYRLALAKSSLPTLPYIGTYLSDLTFIDDGNPDFTKKNLINFQKRELVYGVISEVERCQQVPYAFPKVEPINTFLKELPSCQDKDLYQLSLIYEPRQASSPTPTEKMMRGTSGKSLTRALKKKGTLHTIKE